MERKKKLFECPSTSFTVLCVGGSACVWSRLCQPTEDVRLYVTWCMMDLSNLPGDFQAVSESFLLTDVCFHIPSVLMYGHLNL